MTTGGNYYCMPTRAANKIHVDSICIPLIALFVQGQHYGLKKTSIREQVCHNNYLQRAGITELFDSKSSPNVPNAEENLSTGEINYLDACFWTIFAWCFCRASHSCTLSTPSLIESFSAGFTIGFSKKYSASRDW